MADEEYHGGLERFGPATKREYFVGDVVRIVSEPCACRWNWIPAMDAMCGKTAKITAKISVYPGDIDGYAYYLDGDNGHCAWSRHCFAAIVGDSEELPELAVGSFESIIAG